MGSGKRETTWKQPRTYIGCVCLFCVLKAKKAGLSYPGNNIKFGIKGGVQGSVGRMGLRCGLEGRG